MKSQTRRKALLIALIALALTTPTTVYSAAPKAGSKCSKLGEKSVAGGLTYQCIKSGSKLVWSKGVRVSSSAQGSSSGSSNSGGNNSGGNSSMPSKSATLGQSCSVKNEKGSIPNGTAICEEVNGKLIWQRWMPQGETSDQGSSGGNNSNDSNRVTLGTSCSKKGDSGSSASGTLICALSAGKLTWVEIRKQPIPSDGVWIFGPIGEFKYGPTLKQQSTADWNTDLPPDAGKENQIGLGVIGMFQQLFHSHQSALPTLHLPITLLTLMQLSPLLRKDLCSQACTPCP